MTASFVRKDRMKTTSQTTGTGAYTMSLSPVRGSFNFSGADGFQVEYSAVDPLTGNCEIGLGTVGGGGATLTRDTIYTSSNGNAAVNWAGNPITIGCTVAAEKLQTDLDSKANAATTLTINGTTYDLSANRSWTVTVSSLAWSAITSTPTTLAGYGITDSQPLDADLTAIAALTTDAFGRVLLTKTTAAAVRSYIGAGTSTFDGVYSSLSGVPSTFAPSAHASSHVAAGSDPLTLSESQVTNLTTDLAAKAPLASPALTGTVTVPTAAIDTSTTQAASTAYVIAQLSASGDGTPAMDGTAARGTSTHGARADHVHPTDTSLVPKTTTVNGQALSGNVTISTITGNAGTATALQTARTINGISFDGTANITVTAAAGTLTGSSLAAGVTASSLVSFGSSPTLVTPNIGAATATTINGNTITSGTGTLTLSTFTLTVAGTASVSGANTGDQTSVSGNAGTVTIADAGGDTTTWPLLGTSQTGNLAPATDGGLTYNATTHTLIATAFIGALTGTASGNLVPGGALGTPSSGTLTNCSGLPDGGLTLTDVATNNASTAKHGFVPKLPNDAAKFFAGDGTYRVPSGGGSADGIGGLTIEYIYGTATGPQASGEAFYDTSVFYLSYNDANSTDFSGVLSRIQIGSMVAICKKTTPATLLFGTVVGIATDTGTIEFTVVPSASNGSFSAADAVLFAFAVGGAVGGVGEVQVQSATGLSSSNYLKVSSYQLIIGEGATALNPLRIYSVADQSVDIGAPNQEAGSAVITLPYRSGVLALETDYAYVATAGGVTTLTAGSCRKQVATGSAVQTFVMPDATTLQVGLTFQIENQSTASLTINDPIPALLTAILPANIWSFRLKDNSTAAGTWDSVLLKPTVQTVPGSDTQIVFNASGVLVGSNNLTISPDGRNLSLGDTGGTNQGYFKLWGTNSYIGILYAGVNSANNNVIFPERSNGNVHTIALETDSTYTATAAATTTLAFDSTRTQVATGSTTQTYQLPDARTLVLYSEFVVENESSGAIAVQDGNTTPLIAGIATVSRYLFRVTDISTLAGAWDVVLLTPPRVVDLLQVTPAGATTTLTVASPRNVIFSGGSGGQGCNLPDATTLTVGTLFTIDNETTAQTIQVQAPGGGINIYMRVPCVMTFRLTDNSTNHGSWVVSNGNGMSANLFSMQTADGNFSLKFDYSNIPGSSNCNATFVVSVLASSRTWTLPDQDGTVLMASTTSAPTPQTLLSLPLSTFGSGTINQILGTPDAWALVKHADGTVYKIPLYL